MVSVPARRRQVAYGGERGLSGRRACTLFSVARSALEYRRRKAEGCACDRADEGAVGAVSALLSAHPHFPRPPPGLARRLWRTARLQMPCKRPRKRVGVAALPRPQAPCGPNQVWSYDFVLL